MRAQHQALRVLGTELLHDATPQQPCRAHLGDLEIEVHPDRPEEAEPPGERVDVQAARHGGLHVLHAVGQRERELQCLVRAGLLHVIAGDRDRVELRHLTRRVLDDVGHDAHARLGRVDVGVADHELLEDVVLDGPAQLLLHHALFFGRDHVARQHRQHGAVHRHRDADLVERYAVEQDLHVLDRVDRDAGLAHVASHTRVVAVVAAVRGEVERHAHALPAASQRLPIEGVAFLSGGEAGVLADRPRPHRVHRRLRPAHERLEAGQRVGVRQVRHVGRGVQRLDGDAFGRDPVQAFEPTARRRFGGGLAPLLDRGGTELAGLRHQDSWNRCASSRAACHRSTGSLRSHYP